MGQVARELKPIVLHLGDEEDGGMPPIATGTHSVAASHTYTWPLKRDGRLRGVVEVACAVPLDPTRLAYL